MKVCWCRCLEKTHVLNNRFRRARRSSSLLAVSTAAPAPPGPSALQAAVCAHWAPGCACLRVPLTGRPAPSSPEQSPGWSCSSPIKEPRERFAFPRGSRSASTLAEGLPHQGLSGGPLQSQVRRRTRAGKWKWRRAGLSDSLRPGGLCPNRLLRPWGSPGGDTGGGCHFLLQGLFPSQGSNPGPPDCRQIGPSLMSLGPCAK